jgi:hypothetical protein
MAKVSKKKIKPKPAGPSIGLIIGAAAGGVVILVVVVIGIFVATRPQTKEFAIAPAFQHAAPPPSSVPTGASQPQASAPPTGLAANPNSQSPTQNPATPNQANSDPEAELRKMVGELQAKYDRPNNLPAAMAMGYQRRYLLTSDGRLQKIDLSFTPITDDDLAKLTAAQSIEELELSGTKITDEGAKHLKKFPKLQNLKLYFTSISDACIDDLAAIPSLKYAGVNTTRMTKEGIARLNEAKPGLKAE